MEPSSLIPHALALSPSAISYDTSQCLRAAFPAKGIVESTSCAFDPEEYAEAALCTMTPKPRVHSQRLTDWVGLELPHRETYENSWFDVTWEGQELDLVILTWRGADGCTTTQRFVLAEDHATALRFFLAVCTWTTEVRGEVLVFEGGGWHKSAALYAAIRGATFDNLVLEPALKRELSSDFAQFFASRALYETYGVPWKRGVLLLGPPGNGKTHTVKALVNALGQPCLYVKSFRAQYQTDHDCIRRVFERARKTVPCILVLED